MRIDDPGSQVLRDAFAARGDRRRYPEGAALFIAGDPPGTVFAIVEGEVRILATGPEGEAVVLNTCGTGELLGEISAIDGLPRSASAVAVGSVEVLAVSSGHFNELIESHPALALELLRLLASRIRNATDERVLHRRGDVMTQVAAGIVALADAGGEQVGALVRIQATPRELSRWTGGDREVLSRVLAGLTGEGWIELTADGVDVINLPSLRRLAEDVVAG